MRLFLKGLSLSLLILLGLPVQAEIGWRQGIVSARSLPAPVISQRRVMLEVPHQSQGNRPWCVPVSASMALAYHGVSISAAALKQTAEGHKPASQRNTDFTYWADMQVALRSYGQRWQIVNYPKTERGFREGLNDIRQSLYRGNPVLIDVHLREGHTFVVVGYDDALQQVFIRDPLLREGEMRVLTYRDLLNDWHNHRFHDSRSAFFTSP